MRPKYDTEPCLSVMRESHGLLKGAIMEWRSAPVTLHLGGLPLGPHNYDYTREEDEQREELQGCAMLKMSELLGQHDRQLYDMHPRIWTTNSMWTGPIAEMSNAQFLVQLADDTQPEKLDRVLLIFGGAGRSEALEGMLDLLKGSLVGCGENAAEAVAAVDPNSERLVKMMQWWRSGGRQDAQITHEEATRAMLEIQGRKLKPGERLPRLSVDIVYPFLKRYCRKLGPAKSKAPWVLRESAKR